MSQMEGSVGEGALRRAHRGRAGQGKEIGPMLGIDSLSAKKTPDLHSAPTQYNNDHAHTHPTITTQQIHATAFKSTQTVASEISLQGGIQTQHHSLQRMNALTVLTSMPATNHSLLHLISALPHHCPVNVNGCGTNHVR